ncbi:MAG TPA: redoxin domain-containing protein [Cryomorphaceae bacterium]|nr:redoxin domain-containing protein [Cryomorphaceae bacterium]
MKHLLFFLVFIGNVALAQSEAYKFQITGAEDTVIYLANYYGEKLYYADTAYTDAEGKFAFDAIGSDQQGKYAIVAPGPKYFELVIADDENIHLKTDTADLTGNMEVLESVNNKIMYDYMKYLTAKKEEREKLVAEMEEKKDNTKASEKIKEEYGKLNKEVLNYQKSVIEQNPDKFAAHEILMSIDPEVPENLREDREAGYYWFKEHYFDNIDLTDDRIVRTPIYHTKLVNFLNKTVIQTPDTLIPAIDRLIERMDPNSELFKYTVHYTTYNFETSKIMGLDEVFVHMVDTYYKTGMADWMDDEKLKNIAEKADSKRKTLIGKTAPDLTLADTTGEKWISIKRDIKKEYVVLFFYDPDCGHCKKETPKLVEFFNNYEGDDLAVYAVSSDNSAKWNKFIKKNEMDFYNVAIPQKAYESADFATRLITTGKTNYESLKYQETFDIFSTPKIFVLDQDRVIRAKDIGVEQIGDFLERFKAAAAKEGAESN